MQLFKEELTTKTCLKCYSKNEHSAAECHVCQHPFSSHPESDLSESDSVESTSSESDASESTSSESDSSKPDVSESDSLKSDSVQLMSTKPSSIESNLAQLISEVSNKTNSNITNSNTTRLNFALRLLSENFKKLNQLNFSSLKQEVQTPSFFGGLVFLAVAIALWTNYIIFRHTNFNQLISFSSGNEIEDVKNVPEGLYFYGGASYFAPLVTYGINDAIFAAHPHFQMRYSKPRNLNSAYADGISMLLDGELSFAFNNRPLTEQEYTQASLRKIKLKQIPVALDGVVFFVNNGVTVSKIRLDEVQAIFAGEITNWSQLGGEDLPIVPLVLSKEDLVTLGFTDDSAEKMQFVENHTQILRQVISIPGAISFASASLIANQKSVKSLSLAAPQSNNFVQPFNSYSEPNLKLFKDGSYPLTRRLFVVVREDDTLDEQAGFAYSNFLLSDEGQAIIEAAGLVPVR